MEGYVYVLVNSSIPDLVKIGYTTKSPKDRANELSSTGVPNKFIVAYSTYVSNCVEVEAHLHNFFSDKRHNSGREFFEIDATTAINEILNIEDKFKVRRNEKDDIFSEDVASLYLAKIANYSNVYRIGFIRGDNRTLRSNEFHESLTNLYLNYDTSIILGEIKTIYSEEYQGVDDAMFSRINQHIDNLLRSEKKSNPEIYLSPQKYDERTLNFRETKDSLPMKIFEKVQQSIKPFTIAAQAKKSKQDVENDANIKNKNIQFLKQKGI